MPEHSKKFHEFAIKSILFKGHTDLYLCYIKAEKLAHVLSLLQARSAGEWAENMQQMVTAASRLPETVVHFAAGEMDMSIVLADIFALLTAVRLASTQQCLSAENASVISLEFEQLAEKIAAGSRLSPFINQDDLLLPSLPSYDDTRSLLGASIEAAGQQSVIKDIKGQNKGQKDMPDSQRQYKGQNKRSSLILEFVRKNKSVSIKEIARVIKDCSEKTIQRELALLIKEGLIQKHGERRWSVYSPA